MGEGSRKPPAHACSSRVGSPARLARVALVIFSVMILVTGGAGFIGSNLVAQLVESGERVTVCDQLGRADMWRNLAKHQIEGRIDPSEIEGWLESLEGSLSYVFHMGAVSSTTETDLELITRTNVQLPQFLWRWCSLNEVPFMYASSAATYGDGSHGFDDVQTSSALAEFRPLNPYGQSKHEFDRWVAQQMEVGAPTPPQWVGLKFFNVYGPNEQHKGEAQSVVTKSYARAAAGEPVTLFRSHHPDYADGCQMRDFVYVRDCVGAMAWLRRNEAVNGLFNMGTGKARSWLELMQALYDAVGRELRVRWVDPPAEIRDRYQYFTQANLGKLRRVGYRGEFASVEVGVGDYVRRFLSTSDPYR